MKKGRKSKLTDERMDKFLEAFRMGISIKRCCYYAGIDRSTYHRWMKRGEPEFCDFCNMVKEYELEREVKLLKDIEKDKSWQSKRYLLTLINPFYAEKTRHEIQGSDEDKPVKLDIASILPEDLIIKVGKALIDNKNKDINKEG